MENPYSLVFGKMPSNYIDCELELNEIIETIVEKYFQKREDILIDKRYGKIDFTLPRFKEIACRNIELDFWVN